MKYQAKVINGTLNMRTAPEKKAALIMQIPNGTVVDVIDDAAGWSKIQYHGFTGYVMSEYLEKVNDGADEKLVSVPAAELTKIYEQIGKWLKG